MDLKLVLTRLGRIIAILLIFGIATSTRADSSSWSAPRPVPGTNGATSEQSQEETPLYIYLNTGAFDPLGSSPQIPANLTFTPDEITAAGTYILQFNAPVQDTWKATLTEMGVQIGDYIPDYAFLVHLTTEIRREVEGLPYVRWIGPYQPAYKLSPQVDLSEERSYRITLAPWADAAGVQENLTGIDPDQALAEKKPIAVLNAETLLLVARMPQVIWIEPYYLNELYNDIAAGTIMEASVAWSSGYTGSGNGIAITDSGLDTNHQDFSGRISHVSSWPVQSINLGNNCYTANVGADDGPADEYSGHGSHVTGSVAGSGAASGGRFKGTAYQAIINFQAVEQWTEWSEGCDRNDDFYITGIPSDLRLILNEVYNWGARVQNYSWGGGYSGLYDVQAYQVDDFVYDHPDITLIAAAGNSAIDANWDGYADADSVKSPGVAKNLITVGASDNVRTSGGYSTLSWFQLLGYDFPVNPTRDDRTSDELIELAAFSSRGPTDDGRIKPDLVAPGTNIISVRSRDATLSGWGIYNTYYMYNGGTSMASPLTAGAATLVRDYYRTTEGHSNPSAALIKATLINSAVDIDGYGNQDYEAGQPIPNSHEGWGLVNVGAATTPGKREFVDEATGLSTGTSDTYYYSISSSGPLKVTLTWSDFPASPGASKALVNDLNLRLTSPGGSTVYWGNQFLGGWSRSGGVADTRNNVENVFIQAATTGLWKVEVIGYNVPQGGTQPYALVIDGDIGTKQPLDVTSITPDHAFNNGLLEDALILGAGFEPDAEVQLKQSILNILGTNVSVETSNRISADFNLSGATVGWWDVIVRNPSSNETVTLQDGFYVKDPALPDLAIEKIAYMDHIDAGTLLTYTIAIENIGYVTATGVVFTDTLPADTLFVSLTPDCDGGLDTLLDGFACTVEPLTLTAGASIDYTLVVSVPADLDGFITNLVEVTSQEIDAYALNNQSSASVLSGFVFYYLPFTVKHYSLTSTTEETILNGSFENGPDGSWTEESSNDFELILDDLSPTTITPHAGEWAVWLGGWDDERAAISQDIYVPSGKNLSFWYWSASEEPVCGKDTARVMINQAVIAEIDLCTSAETNQWTKRTLSLSAYANTTANLKFIVQTNSDLNSNLFLDDVSFE